MKRLIAFAWLFVIALASCSDDKNNPTNPGDGSPIKFAVIADPHVFDPSLGATSQAFESYRNQFPCLFDKSEAILKCAVDDIIADKAITHVVALGDFTMRGEKKSMVKFLAQMKRLEDAGKIVIAMPGDADLNNPDAKIYSGATSQSTENVTPAWYATAAKDYAPPALVASTEFNDLKIYEPVDGVWFMLLGNNKTLGTEAEAWVTSKLQEAKQKGKEVIVFMTRNLLPQYDGHGATLPNNYLDFSPKENANKSSLYTGGIELAKKLKDGGVNLVFTAGDHATNTTNLSGSFLWDVATGSLCAAGNVYRIVNVKSDGSASVIAAVANSDWNTESTPAENVYYGYYRDNFALAWLNYVADNSDYSYSACSAYADVIASSLFAHIIGNEDASSALWKSDKYDEFMSDFPGTFADYLYSITHEPNCQDDHELFINLK